MRDCKNNGSGTEEVVGSACPVGVTGTCLSSSPAVRPAREPTHTWNPAVHALLDEAQDGWVLTSVVRDDTPQVRGLIHTVRHLVVVEEVND